MMLLSKRQLSYLNRYEFSFTVPSDLSDLSDDQLVELLDPVYEDIGDAINDEPTSLCYLSESVFELIQDNRQDIIDLFYKRKYNL